MNDKAPVPGKAKPIANWTPDDTKLLIITAGATVAANIITIVVVALAIVVARSTHLTPGATVGYWVFFWASAFFPLMTIAMVVVFWRNRRGRAALDSFVDRVIRWVMAFAALFSAFMTLIYLLSLIGLATGIK